MKSTLKIGLITAVISSVFLFGFFSVVVWLNTKCDWGMRADTIRGVGGLLSIPIQAIGIYIAMQDIKRTTGVLSYGQAIKTGLIVAITIAVVVAIFSFLYCQFNPGYTEYMVKDAQKAMIAAGESAQQIKDHSTQVAQEYTMSMQVIQALVGQFVTGTILSLILGLFVKNKK